jgi:hypothetical protein
MRARFDIRCRAEYNFRCRARHRWPCRCRCRAGHCAMQLSKVLLDEHYYNMHCKCILSSYCHRKETLMRPSSATLHKNSSFRWDSSLCSNSFLKRLFSSSYKRQGGIVSWKYLIKEPCQIFSFLIRKGLRYNYFDQIKRAAFENAEFNKFVLNFLIVSLL